MTSPSLGVEDKAGYGKCGMVVQPVLRIAGARAVVAGGGFQFPGCAVVHTLAGIVL